MGMEACAQIEVRKGELMIKVYTAGYMVYEDTEVKSYIQIAAIQKMLGGMGDIQVLPTLWPSE